MLSEKGRGFVLVVSGPSGSGKSTVVKAFLGNHPEFGLSVSHTTRPMRSGEIDGEDYYFVSEDQFNEMIDGDEFLEWADVFGNFYGTSKASIEEIISSGKNAILEIDVKGAVNIRGMYAERAVLVFVIPEDFGKIQERLEGRRTETEEELNRRISEAQKEIEYINLYDYVIINSNNQIGQTVEHLAAICRAESARVSRFWKNYKDEFWRKEWQE